MSKHDATDDYVTCSRCRVMRPAAQRACPKCSLDKLLTVERFYPSPAARRRAALLAATHESEEQP